MVPLKVGGMQNTLTSVDDAGAPPVAMAPAGAPFSVMVRTACEPNAPLVRCLHAVQGSDRPGHPVKPAQSPSPAHATGGFLNDPLLGAPQKPQKTRVSPGWL